LGQFGLREKYWFPDESNDIPVRYFVKDKDYQYGMLKGYFQNSQVSWSLGYKSFESVNKTDSFRRLPIPDQYLPKNPSGNH
jgi:hypothetical protein